MVDLIKPSELPPASQAYADSELIIEDAGAVKKATAKMIADAGAPVATEAQALAGVNNERRMTPLRVKQVLDNVAAPSVLRAQAWAESPTQPDPTDPTSESSKTWAERAKEAAVVADAAKVAAQGYAEAAASTSLKMFGATGLGDQAKDEAAWDAAFAAFDVVYAPAGLYIVRNKTIPSGKSLYGDGENTIFKHPDIDLNGGASTTVRIYEGENIRAWGFTVDGNKSGIIDGDINNCEGFSIKYGKNCHLSNIKVINAYSEGVDFDESEDCSASFITGVDCGGMCIHISENNRRVFSSNSIAIRCGIDSSRAAFDLWSSSKDCGIINCYSDGSYRGAQVRGTRNRLIGFTAVDCIEWGMWLDGTECSVSDLIVDGACLGDGLSNPNGVVFQGTNCSASNITIGGVAVGRGLYCTGSGNKFSNVTIGDVAGASMSFSSGSQDNTVNGISTTAGSVGIFDQGVNNKFASGVLSGSTSHPAQLNGTKTSAYGIVSRATTGDGFYIGGDNITLTDCRCESASAAGFRTLADADSTTFVGCSSSGHTTAALSDNGTGTQVLGGSLGQSSLTSALTISGGSVTLRTARSNIAVPIATEAGANTDDLDTITGGYPGQIIVICAASHANDVVVKHNTGNIRLNGLADFTLDANSDTLVLMWIPAASRWCEIARSNNGS